MAEISLSLPSLPDILSPIIDPPLESPVIPTVTAPPDTVTVTADPSSSTSSITRSSSTSSVTSRSQTSAPVSTSSSSIPAENNSTSTEPPEFLTTTYLTQEGSSFITVTSRITNPARTHSNPGTNDFFSNKTAVIGVFTACAIVGFAIIIAFIAWVARRRTLKRWEREEAEKEFDRRNFLQDEIQDSLAPSEKSWWASGSGTSIPDGTGGMPMQNANFVLYNGMPPPGQQTELSPVATTFSGSHESKGAPTSAESIGPISHPYSGSVVSEPYHLTSPRAQHSSIASISSVREVARSPPPSIPLPPAPYSNRGQDPSHLPIILEGPPSSSSEGWSQSLATHSAPLSRSASHPYASPPTNRKSELYAEDVLLDLGSKGGVGRSLSGSRPAHPALPTQGASSLIRKASKDGGSQGQGSIGHHGSSSASHPAMGNNVSGSGLSDGAWHYDSNPFGGGAAEPALASHLPPTEVVQRRMVAHDPRFSGVFGTGTWTDRQAAYRQSDSMGSDLMGTEDEHLGGSSPYTPRVLRVTNE